MVGDQRAGAGRPVGPQAAAGVGEHRDPRPGRRRDPHRVGHRAGPVALVEVGAAEVGEHGQPVQVVGAGQPAMARRDRRQEPRQRGDRQLGHQRPEHVGGRVPAAAQHDHGVVVSHAGRLREHLRGLRRVACVAATADTLLPT